MAQNEPLLPASVLRGIGDKLYDRRKTAALEVEGLVKHLASQVHGREYLESVVPAVLNSLVDQDARVRYYALEALYNIAKVTREDFMPFFGDTFDALFRLCADMDTAVHQATTFLDNLMKDIVTASSDFDLEAFVPQLREYLTVLDAKKRMFLISWVSVLASVPDIDLLGHLPQLLGGMLDALKTEWREVRTAAGKALQEFLIDIQATHSVDFNSLAAILCARAKGNGDPIRLICMRWLRQFVIQAKVQLRERYADILAAVLPCLSHSNPEIAAEAVAANRELLVLPQGWEAQDTRHVLAIVGSQLGSEHEATHLAALHWMTTLLLQSRDTVMESLDVLLPALLDALNAPSERVVVESLAVQASIAEDERHFRQLMQLLLDRFRGPAGAKLLSKHGSLAIRKFAAMLGGRRVFQALAASLENEEDLYFATSIVQALNLILLSAPESRHLHTKQLMLGDIQLQEVRQLLAGRGDAEQGAAIFEALYQSWSHSAGAALSLCFLAQAYGHASDLIGIFKEVQMGVQTLVQIDRLVQILETPVFTPLRLHLLQPARYPALLRCLYGLLMLLPQSAAFKTLHARLHSVPTLALLQLEAPTQHPSGSMDISTSGYRNGVEAVGTPSRIEARSNALDGIEEPGISSGVSSNDPAGSSEGVTTFQRHVDFSRLLSVFRHRQERLAEAVEKSLGVTEAEEDLAARMGRDTERKLALTV